MLDWLVRHLQRHTSDMSFHPLQKWSIVGLVTLLLITTLVGNIPATILTKTDSLLSAVLPSVIVDLTNTEREKRDLQPLTRNELLDRAAELKATHMKQLNYFAHYSPEGVSPWFWFDMAKYDYLYAGENLAVYFEDSDDVVKAWMESPLHKENILKPEYTEIGVAAVEGKYDGYSTVFVVQLFGTPAKKNPVPVIEVKEESRTTQKVASMPVTTTEEAVRGETIESVEEKNEFNEQASSTLFVTTEKQESTQETIPNTSIERVELDGDTVYISDHMSTSSTISQTGQKNELSVLGNTNSITKTATETILNYLYVFLAIIVTGLITSSIIFASRQKHTVQALYGIGLLFSTLAITAFHAYIILV